ncbi:hypothetical protein PDJ82_20410 [Bacillus cereus group sp. TH43LC]|uniref:hypothetical protein n=1 Tax=Bacillus cereus group TaxID=86661 RepID=UPI0022E6850A|nr:MULTISPECIES: hypothetical protein [unclassified Bacillus cereus group]MDA1503943.1 hypothetical protein [Bacillus cereus group sp. TH43LC]MDA1790879.1 hypothetical protein [Bacillus cereus group sp. BY5-1LC]MDA1865781.1 hypothetical protein [Bacillus cereus group sp. BY128LC]
MPILYGEVNRTYIESVLKKLLDGEFHSSIRNKLLIEDLTYDTEYTPFKLIGGYPEDKTQASCLSPHEGETLVRKVIFFTESISIAINHYFRNVPQSPMFNEIVNIYTKFVVIHELVHVQQFKNGLTMEKYNSSAYEDSEDEAEANKKAEELLASEGAFQREVVKFIIENRSVYIDDIGELLNIYTQQFQIHNS